MMKKTQGLVMFAILAVSVALIGTQIVWAQSQTQTYNYTVNLNYMTVQLSYPSQVNPGDSVTVNVQATAKNNVYLSSLAAQILYSDGTNLRQITSATLTSNYQMNSGASMNKQIQFTVPQDAPRTSLIAVLTEKVQTTSSGYYYYPGYYNSSYYSPGSCYYDYYGNYYCNGSYYGYGNYYYPYCNYGYYPEEYACSYGGYYGSSQSYAPTSDSGVGPLSTINAQTPEYVSLQSEYQQVQQQLAQSQAQNQQLQQNLQNAQNSNAQSNATIADLNQQLNSSKTMTGTLEAATGILAVIAILCGALAIHYRGKNKTQPMPQKSSTQPESSP